ncbi:hypothetical protein EB34_01835 [Enterococcus faecalis]|uniref:pyocin knob domain-containing protein n=1 Tax=Enterococcus faecalis TaxID=1351 RepID=UPI000DEAAED3|nr:pyocin knob domain-containing protein [Enterococcus faecalis]RBR57406.1 hypothetical protein EB34_01835 [Enterococcus faecalis]
MSYEKQHWQTYDELKTEEENKALGAVVTSERMNHVEDGIAISHENIDSHIKQFDNPHKVTSEQVGAYTKEESNKKFAALGSSYTKKESENLFIEQTEAENGLFVRKNSKISDLNDAVEPGIYSIPATGVENKPLPNSGSLIVNKDSGGVRQLFQTERTMVIRQFGGIPSTWTDWKEVAFAPNVVNLSNNQEIDGVKNFKKNPKISGVDIASTEDILATNKVYRYLRTSLDLSNKVQAAKDAINATESKVDICRVGNMVFFNMRINVKDYTKFGNDMPVIYDLPMGFRTLGDLISNTYFNNSLSVSQWAFAQSAAKNYMAIAEGSPQDIRFSSSHNGNTYVQGSWLTKDPFPKEGSLNGGTVSILNRLPDGSLT